jgi:hypothetical protein
MGLLDEMAHEQARTQGLRAAVDLPSLEPGADVGLAAFTVGIASAGHPSGVLAAAGSGGCAGSDSHLRR